MGRSAREGCERGSGSPCRIRTRHCGRSVNARLMSARWLVSESRRKLDGLDVPTKVKTRHGNTPELDAQINDATEQLRSEGDSTELGRLCGRVAQLRRTTDDYGRSWKTAGSWTRRS